MNTTALNSDPHTEARTDRLSMKAIVRDQYGSAEGLQLREVPMPEMAEDEVRVRIHAAGLDRGVWHVMAGLPYLVRIVGYGLRRPKKLTLGLDFSGVVQRVGSKVSGLKPGDRVFGLCKGSFAEYAVARVEKIARMPANASFEQAAAVPVSALTALQALRDHGRLKAGQRVLIVGASGGVGTFAVQLAKAFGATVTGVCSGSKLEFVRSLGADEVIDYTRTPITELKARFDLVLDIGGNRPVSQLRRVLTDHGTLVMVGGEDGDRWTGGLGRQLGAMLVSPFIRQRLVPMMARENSQDLETLAGLIEAGAIVPAVDRVCALAEVPSAMRDLEQGRVRGKVVVTVFKPLGMPAASVSS